MTTIRTSTSDWLAALTSRHGASRATAPSSVLQTANNTLFRMSNLMGNVRTMARTASEMRTTDVKDLDMLRKNVASAMKQFDDISTAGGYADTKTTDTEKIASMSLNELRSTLKDMQSNLQENFRTVAGGIQKAIANGSTMSAPQPSTETLTETWARLYGK